MVGYVAPGARFSISRQSRTQRCFQVGCTPETSAYLKPRRERRLGIADDRDLAEQ